ncbi:MAG: hypothetical protein CML68_17235 [Rhodobacteraceae bacterium]|nr:hypothetical protein [Paracoccaceae bacterium]
MGEAGNDWLDGGTGADTIRAGDGDDWIIGDANDLVIQGGAGYDTVDFSGSGAGVYLSQNDTKLSGLEHVIGTDMDDTIQYTSSVEDLTLEGGDGNDNLNSGSGNDTLIGGDGNDYLHGGYGGNDLLYGEAGNDIIYANDGDDMIWGGIGDDDIIVNDGNDIGYGGDGDDTLYCWDWNIGDAELYGEAGNDRIYIWGGSLYASGGDGDDVLEMEGLDSEERYSIMNGDAGNDTFRVYYGNGYLSGGEGTDEFFFHEYGYSADVVLTDWDNEALYFSEYFLYDYPDPVPVDPGPEDIMAFASVVGDDIVFNFTGDYSDNTVTLQGVTDLDLVESWVSLF